MKRRKLLKYLVLMSPVLLISSCKQEEFARDTIISGEIIDHEGNPIEGFWIRFMGEESGLSGKAKFHIEAYTDSLGKFILSQRIPKGTDHAVLFMEGFNDRWQVEHYELYQKGNEKYELIQYHDLGIPRSQWGKSIEFKFKTEKI